MRKLLFVLPVFILTCGSGTNINYADSLSPCLYQSEIEQLNYACQVFENHLQERYENEDISKSYRLFLQDIGNFNVDPQFCLTSSSRDVLDDFRSTGLIEKIWKPSSVILDQKYGHMFSRSDYFPEGSEDLFIIDPNDFYLVCMRKSEQNPPTMEYLDYLVKTPNASISFNALDLADRLTDEELQSGLTRLAVAIGFFYQMAVMFE